MPRRGLGGQPGKVKRGLAWGRRWACGAGSSMGRQDMTRGQTYLEGAGGRRDASEDGSKQLGEQECHRPRQQSWGRGRDEGELEVLAGHQVVVAHGPWSMESDPRMGGQGLRRRRGTWRRLRTRQRG